VRDAIAAEASGVPTVLVLNGALRGIAAETARVAGLPGLPIVTLEQPLHGLERDAIAAVAAPLAPAVAEALVAA
jgi:hypothetical protein